MNYLVFKERGYGKGNMQHPYEHNERKQRHYNNGNIDLSLSKNNIYYKRPTGSYQEMVEELIRQGRVSTKGLKEDADLISEVIISVNADFWEDKTEEYIKKFFKAVYDYFYKKFNGLILSAVVHQDEVFEACGKTKCSRHMHIVGVPTVEKKNYYSRRSRVYKELAAKEEDIRANDPRLLKDSIRQISHSKFFDSHKSEHRMVYGYSVIQDELVSELKESGFEIERGRERSNAIPLHPNQYKQLMERIEYDGSLLPVVEPREVEEGYLISREEAATFIEKQKNVNKQIAAYDLAVDSLNRQYEWITENYGKEMEVYETLEKLSVENQKLKSVYIR